MMTKNTEGPFGEVLKRAALMAESVREYWDEYEGCLDPTYEQMGIGLELDDHLDAVIEMLQELVTRWKRHEVTL